MFDKLKSTHNADRTSDRAMDVKTAEPAMAAPAGSASAGLMQTAGKAAVIGAGIKINGEISGNENLLIEGQVDGRINLAGNDVTIGKSGRVVADVSAKTIRVAGEVNGDLKAKERVVISGSGNVRGNVVAPRVVLEDGAIFKGSIDMDPGDSANAEQAAAKSASKPNGATLSASVSASAAPISSGSAAQTGAEAVKNTPDLALKGG
ncbi:MAG: polymer-forming cytoskeletal protein [Xanthomonadales bacterium]|nr:polymer-forming cytoskeletal protein [Xanthomonadales bacterium]